MLYSGETAGRFLREIRDNSPETPDQPEAEITKAIFISQINRQGLKVDNSK
jgi:hypothetical protein